MQANLLSDGEYPPPLCDYHYLVDYYVDCEEMGRPLAEALAKSIVDYAPAFAKIYKYNIGKIKAAKGWDEVTLVDTDGAVLARVCYADGDYTSSCFVFSGLSTQFNKIIWL